MREVERMVDQLERAYRGGAWHGPSLREVLDGVDADAASARPIAEAHTIRELVAHVIAWQKECLARLGGGGKKLPPEEDWPLGPEGWTAVLDELDATHEKLANAISKLGDDDLGREVAFGEPGTSVYVLVHGVIQHNLYHAGQMALLKKAR